MEVATVIKVLLGIGYLVYRVMSSRNPTNDSDDYSEAFPLDIEDDYEATDFDVLERLAGRVSILQQLGAEDGAAKHEAAQEIASSDLTPREYFYDTMRDIEFEMNNAESPEFMAELNELLDVAREAGSLIA